MLKKVQQPDTFVLLFKFHWNIYISRTSFSICQSSSVLSEVF